MERPSLWDAACKTQDNACDHILQKELTVNENRISGPNLAILQKADRGTPNSSKTSRNFRRNAVRRDGNGILMGNDVLCKRTANLSLQQLKWRSIGGAKHTCPWCQLITGAGAGGIGADGGHNAGKVEFWYPDRAKGIGEDLHKHG
jgi:hypothetical protein